MTAVLHTWLSVLAVAFTPALAHAESPQTAPLAPPSSPTSLSSPSTSTDELHTKAVFTDTNYVEALAARNGQLWVGTRGGLELYDPENAQRLAVYTAAQGLPETRITRLAADAAGVHFSTPHHDCTATVSATASTVAARLMASCKPRSLPSNAPVSFTDRNFVAGRRVTARLEAFGREVVGTAGAGLFVDGHPVTPASLPGPHVTALATFRDQLWIGTFNDGVARLTTTPERSSFARVSAPFRKINGMLTAAARLWVASSEGLFVTRDGIGFERVDLVAGPATSVAFDGVSLWATTPGALYRVRVDAGPRSDVWWEPAGSRSLQKVTARTGSVWVASEDRGAIHLSPTSQLRARDKPFTVFDRTRGLASSWALEAAEDAFGDTWVASLRDGVFRSRDGWQVPGLPCAWIWTVASLGSDVWIGTQSGAARYAAGETQIVAGLPDPSVHVFAPGSLDEHAGIWIGTANGLAWLPAPSRGN